MIHPRTKPATSPRVIPPEPVPDSSKTVDAFVEVSEACDDRVVLANTATPSANPSYGYANA
jgi:hypothetical protein